MIDAVPWYTGPVLADLTFEPLVHWFPTVLHCVSVYLPQQLSVGKVVSFLQIDEAHGKGGFPLSLELLQPAHDELQTNR